MTETNTLSIIIPSDINGSFTKNEQKILISHLRITEFQDTSKEICLSPSPGIVLLIPANRVQILQSDSQSTKLESGMIFVFDGYSANSIQIKCLDSYIRNSPTWLNIIEINAIINSRTSLREHLNLPFRMNFSTSDKIYQVFQQLELQNNELLLERDSFDVTKYILSIQIVHQLMTASKSNINTMEFNARNTDISKLKKYLNRNLSKHITTSDMARFMALSRTSFNRLITPLLKMPPAQYLRKMRLERSMELLLRSDKTIENIAAETGFSDRYHFNNAFKKHFKTSPGKYRKNRSIKIPDNDLSLALSLFQAQRYDEAVELYDSILKSNRAYTNKEKVLYNKALCLYTMGRSDEALELWESQRESSFAFPAIKQLCNHYFHSGDYEKSLHNLSRLFKQANSAQQKELIGIWVDHATELKERRLPNWLCAYLDFRRDNFIEDIPSMELTLNAFKELGLNHRAIAECSKLKLQLFILHRSTGEFNHALNNLTEDIPKNQIATMLMSAGRYYEILDISGIPPKFYADALFHLSRTEEAIERFPDYCSSAYLARKQYRKVLKCKHNELRKIYALHALNRITELKNRYKAGNWEWFFAQYYIDPKTIISTSNQFAHAFIPTARLLIVLSALKSGDKDSAHENLTEIKPIYSDEMWFTDYVEMGLLLAPVVHAFLGNRQRMEKEFQTILEKYKFVFAQSLWHDVAFLKDIIDLKTYRNQPLQINLDKRLEFIEGLRADLDNNQPLAREKYNLYCKNSSIYGILQLIQHRFIQWRNSTGS